MSAYLLVLTLGLSAAGSLIAAEDGKVLAKPADCDSKLPPKVDLDPKAIEAKAAEDKALQNLGLIAAPAAKPPVPVPPPAPEVMASCK